MCQVRAITQEHSGSIQKTDGDDNGRIGRKNKMAYYFAVLEDLLGLRPDEPTTQPGQQGRRLPPV